jgi:hypothetical protein
LISSLLVRVPAQNAAELKQRVAVRRFLRILAPRVLLARLGICVGTRCLLGRLDLALLG